MRVPTITLVMVLAGLCGPAFAQSAADRTVVARFPPSFSLAWGHHMGKELARLVAPDVDFVNVGAIWLRGRADFETYHARILAGRFRASTITPLETDVKFIRPDLALVRWSWRIDGERDDKDLSMPVRYGLMTLLAEKRDGDWSIIAGQNTNSGPARAEAADIVAPIRVPRAP